MGIYNMKYIDAKRLRAEITKLLDSVVSCPFIEAEVGAEERREGKIRAYNEILASLDSLQQEQPVLLTQEILEKNFPEPTDGLTWYPEEGGFNCHTYVPKCEINAFGLFKYVHQLQHALRLCGIDKEIDL